MKTQKLKHYLKRAVKERFALPAFNFLNMETAQVFVEASEEARAPIILQISENSVKYAGFSYIESLARLADQSPDVFIHLDHGVSPELIDRCLESIAFSSVMVDSSKLPFFENLSASKATKQHANCKLVEAELGHVGGKEDDLETKEPAYTNLKEAIAFVRETKVDLLAPAVGTLHGVYKEAPRLNYALVEALREVLPLPLVLHGASGLKDEEITRMVESGMNKINMDTELKQGFLEGLSAYLAQHPGAYDLRKVFMAAKDAMKEIALHKIRLCRAEGKTETPIKR